MVAFCRFLRKRSGWRKSFGALLLVFFHLFCLLLDAFGMHCCDILQTQKFACAIYLASCKSAYPGYVTLVNFAMVNFSLGYLTLVNPTLGTLDSRFKKKRMISLKIYTSKHILPRHCL